MHFSFYYEELLDVNNFFQGSLIEMIGPKRGISMGAAVLLEFDMRIKKGEQEKDDLQLIDGVSDFCEPDH
jgi:hypothetical protein